MQTHTFCVENHKIYLLQIVGSICMDAMCKL